MIQWDPAGQPGLGFGPVAAAQAPAVRNQPGRSVCEVNLRLQLIFSEASTPSSTLDSYYGPGGVSRAPQTELLLLPPAPANTRTPVPAAGVNAVHCPSALAKSLMMSKLCEFWGPKAILDVAFVGASPFLPGYP